MEVRIGNSVLALWEGDITKFAADAIANAANSKLIGGGGVDGAIHRAGGPEIMRELDLLRGRTAGCSTGSAVATGAGKLPAKFVFHAVGPVYRDGRHGEPDLLASCYTTCLKLAEQHGAKTLAFPSISTGVYGYPMEEAAAVAIRTISEFLRCAGCKVERVTLVVFGREAFETYGKVLAKLRPQRKAGPD